MGWQGKSHYLSGDTVSSTTFRIDKVGLYW